MGSLPKKSVLFGQVFRKWASFGEKRFHSHYGYWLELLQLWGKVIGQWAHVLRKLQLGWYRSGEHTCIAIYVPITWWGPKKVQSCNRWKSTNCEVCKPSVRRHSAKLKVDATLTLMKFLPISNPASGELTILLFGGGAILTWDIKNSRLKMTIEEVEAAIEAEFVITSTWWKWTLNAEHLREMLLIPRVTTVNFNCWPNISWPTALGISSWLRGPGKRMCLGCQVISLLKGALILAWRSMLFKFIF